jgi:hypothetical protein
VRGVEVRAAVAKWEADAGSELGPTDDNPSLSVLMGYIASRVSAPAGATKALIQATFRLRDRAVPFILGTSLALSSLAWSAASCTYAILWIQKHLSKKGRMRARARKLVFREGGRVYIQRNLLDNLAKALPPLASMWATAAMAIAARSTS